LLSNGEEPWNKWFQGDSSTSFVTIDFNGTIREITSLAFKSANDCPHRDPDSAQVSAWVEGESEKRELASFELTFDAPRWQTLKFDLPDSVRVSKVEINFINGKGHY